MSQSALSEVPDPCARPVARRTELELLPVGYHHVVFTLPHELSWLALQNKKVVYDLLFRASAATLLDVAADAKHLGAAIGFLSVLHTWGQNLLHHPHVHCVIPVGGLSPDRTQWVHPRYPFFLSVKVLSRVFRGKFIAGLRRAFRVGRLSFSGRLQSLSEAAAFRGFLRRLFRHDWVVYAKPPFGGPTHVLQYLARYTHRVAISNHRILNVADDSVTFQWKDYRHGSQPRTMTIRCGRISPAILLARPAQGFRPHSFLWVSRASSPRTRSPTVPECPCVPRPSQASHDADRRGDDAFGRMALSALWRSDDRDRTIDGVPDLRARHCGEDPSLTARDRRAALDAVDLSALARRHAGGVAALAFTPHQRLDSRMCEPRNDSGAVIRPSRTPAPGPSLRRARPSPLDSTPIA